MSKKELLKKLKTLIYVDTETAHVEADKLLIKYINDLEITEAYEKIDKWYS